MFRKRRRIFQEKSVICIRLPANAHHRHVNTFFVAGNSSKLPVTQKGRMKNEALFFTRSSHPIPVPFSGSFFKFFSRLPQFRLLPECGHPKISATTGQDCLSGTQLTTWGFVKKSTSDDLHLFQASHPDSGFISNRQIAILQHMTCICHIRLGRIAGDIIGHRRCRKGRCKMKAAAPLICVSYVLVTTQQIPADAAISEIVTAFWIPPVLTSFRTKTHQPPAHMHTVLPPGPY